MGGRGSTSNFTVRNTARPMPTQQQAQAQQNQNTVANQAPDPNNTPATPGGLTALSQMSDDDLAKLYQTSKTVDMPNHLNDVPDATQRFAFAAGLNEKPVVLDQSDFDNYLTSNGIPRSQIISRSVSGVSFNSNGVTFKYSAQDVTDMMKYSSLNYVGGKVGGQAYGAGTYFDMNGGGNTSYTYGGATAIAVLNPSTAKVIRYDTLMNKVSTFARSHPKFAAQVGGFSSRNASIYALAMGYNVIAGTGGRSTYRNVIDRAALVYRAENA